MRPQASCHLQVSNQTSGHRSSLVIKNAKYSPHSWASQHPRTLQERISRGLANSTMDTSVTGIGTKNVWGGAKGVRGRALSG